MNRMIPAARLLLMVAGLAGSVEAGWAQRGPWTPKAPMPTARAGLAVGEVNGVLYAVGGKGEKNWKVEAYDPRTDTWTTKATMPTARFGLAIGAVNGILYAVGGGGDKGPLATVEAYDPKTDTWTTKALMSTVRMGLGVTAVNGILYAVGGIPGAGSPPTTMVESYIPARDIQKKLWTLDTIVARSNGLLNPASYRKVYQTFARANRSSAAWIGVLSALGVAIALSVVASVYAVKRRQERDRAHQALRTSQQLLLETQTSLVSSVSHELKTPLALIRLFGETLETGLVTDEAQRREFSRIIRRESERLTHLIDTMLDFSKMDTSRKEYHFEEGDVVEVVRRTLGAYAEQLRDLGFEVVTHLPAEPVIATFDPEAITQALVNLFNNATKYAEDEKSIRVAVIPQPGWVRLSVEDHGVGMAQDEQERIFDKFYRGRAGKRLGTGGSGLGLTLVKHIMDAHGGTIDVRSVEGEGSTFTLSLPLDASPRSPAP